MASICFKVADFLHQRRYENPSVGCEGYFTPNNTLTLADALQLFQFCKDAASADSKGEPMGLIAMFIAVTSLLCAFGMLADLFYGLRNAKLWFPCFFFSINGAFLSIIPFVMMLSGDLTGEMPGEMEQVSKLATLALMCIFMVNVMPSLASMDNTSLLQNVSGLSLFTVTMIVYVIIQIRTGVIGNYVSASSSSSDSSSASRYLSILDCAYTYVVMISVLQIITISSSLAIPVSKGILEWKYLAIKKKFSTDQQPPQMSSVDKLTQHVRMFWVMAETASPQFVMAISPLSTVCGAISVVVLLMHSVVAIESASHNIAYEYGSAYKGSLIFVYVTQSLVVVVGAIAPLFRCFSVLSFKFATKDYLKVYKVENYWTQTLSDWKQSHTRFLSTRFVLYNLKNMFLNICIGFQMGVVIFCKVIWLFSLVILKSVAYCFESLRAKLCTPPINQISEDLSRCALQITDEVEFSEEMLQGLSNSVNSFIAEQKEDTFLIILLSRPYTENLFKEIDDDQLEPLQISVELVMSWSLTIVNLTSIAISLPQIPRYAVQFLMKGVREGLSYTHFVEATLNPSSEYVNVQKAAIALWDEVENNHKWLKNSLSNDAFEGMTAKLILKWFSDKAQAIFTQTSNRGIMVQGRIPMEIIASDSMYRIANTISKFRDQPAGTEPISIVQLFDHLRDMISTILYSCFTNIPQGIKMKCEESVVEERVSSVRQAAEILGKTEHILNRLDQFGPPAVPADKIAYIKEWHLHYKSANP